MDMKEEKKSVQEDGEEENTEKTQFLLCSLFVTATLKPAREQPREEREKLNVELYRMLRVDRRAHAV